ncbi:MULTISPECIES: alpha/beta fold hydrolase [unclassified Bradyrhizobium]|uniref:alpha/beta fold hydrolase n=1 Tax=Bradyrhizobium TaxID=374 RepID=UPI002915C97E|nr:MULTISPECIES: alpha/beta hydrolase [unclassified Bradyrhizobium]
MRHRHIEAAGIRLHVAEIGNGPAVLFCHGFPAIWSSWRSQMEAVARAGWRAIALDMRGYGESGAPDDAEAYTSFECVGDLVGILDQLEIPSAVIVGHDFGASVAWNAAMMRPDCFTAVFGISVPFRRPGGPSFLDQLRTAGTDDFYMFAQMRPEADQAWADAATTIPGCYYWTSGQAPDDMRWDPFDPSRGLLRAAPEPLRVIDQAYLDEAVASFARTGFHGPLNYYRAIDRFFRIASRAYAGAVIPQPTFFMTGARDGLNSVRRPSETTMRTALPGLAGFETIEEAGHWPQLETPDRVNVALLAFLSEIAGPAQHRRAS